MRFYPTLRHIETASTCCGHACVFLALPMRPSRSRVEAVPAWETPMGLPESAYDPTL